MDNTLIQEYGALLHEREQLNKRIEATKAMIIEGYQEQIAQRLVEKDEPFGDVTIGEIVFSKPKKVTWDQGMLSTIYKDIGNTANEYIKVKYTVQENKYKNWPNEVQEHFIDARTVSDGNISIKLKESK